MMEFALPYVSADDISSVSVGLTQLSCAFIEDHEHCSAATEVSGVTAGMVIWLWWLLTGGLYFPSCDWYSIKWPPCYASLMQLSLRLYTHKQRSIEVYHVRAMLFLLFMNLQLVDGAKFYQI
ncbi:hypothetical protein K1719_001880 [Acacia pycnantha]|nr:hypothetical protein K1719_001880 [Acacia pycnantha]